MFTIAGFPWVSPWYIEDKPTFQSPFDLPGPTSPHPSSSAPSKWSNTLPKGRWICGHDTMKHSKKIGKSSRNFRSMNIYFSRYMMIHVLICCGWFCDVLTVLTLYFLDLLFMSHVLSVVTLWIPAFFASPPKSPSPAPKNQATKAGLKSTRSKKPRKRPSTMSFWQKQRCFYRGNFGGFGVCQWSFYIKYIEETSLPSGDQTLQRETFYKSRFYWENHQKMGNRPLPLPCLITREYVHLSRPQDCRVRAHISGKVWQATSTKQVQRKGRVDA